MVSVFDELVIEERPWYVAYEEGAPFPADPTVEPVAVVEVAQEETADKPKRKTWKDAVAEKAKELEVEASGIQVDTESES